MYATYSVPSGATESAGSQAPGGLLPAPEDPPSSPVRVHGKFFFAGERKHFVKGVTYGPFGVGSHGAQFPEIAVVEQDFALMHSAGINTVRVFTVPPLWLLDAADEAGLKESMRYAGERAGCCARLAAGGVAGLLDDCAPSMART